MHIKMKVQLKRIIKDYKLVADGLDLLTKEGIVDSEASKTNCY